MMVAVRMKVVVDGGREEALNQRLDLARRIELGR